MEYLFIFTYSVIFAATAGVILAAIVALLSKEHKLKRFQSTLGYTTLIVTILIISMAAVNW